LELLTTPKYRALYTPYTLFRLADNTGFIGVIALCILNAFEGNGQGFRDFNDKELALFSAIGLNIFYNTMLQTHKFWGLQRYSFYLGLLFFCSYFALVFWNNAGGGYDDGELKLVLTVLSLTLFFFLGEACIDVAIDAELHNDCLRLQEMKVLDASQELDSKDPLLIQRGAGSWISRYLDVGNTVVFPNDVTYGGSMFAWGIYSVFAKDVWSKSRVPFWVTVLLCAGPNVVVYAGATIGAFFSKTILMVSVILWSALGVVLGCLVLYFCVCTRCTEKHDKRYDEEVNEGGRCKQLIRELTHF